MYKLTGIKLVFNGMPNRGDGPDNSVCVDIPLNDNQLGEVAELIGSFSQQSVQGGQAKKGSFEIFHDNNPGHTNECAGYRE